ncbi:MAG: sugar phosphate nucleotidyltransferase [Patescibacteria group bacterium]
MNIVILAGGVGKRLWPLGRKNNPKQFFPVVGKKPLVKETFDRFAKTYGAKKIFFSTTVDLLPYLKKLFPKLSAEQFIVEPSRRDTGPAMGFAAVKLFLQSPDEPMVFVPSDHFIADVKKYLACFKIGEKLIKETGKMLDIGVVATFPSTVLGYTKIGKKCGNFGGVEVYNFAGHTEKPNYATAKKYLASGNYLWHGNYYMWTPRLFLNAMKKYAPTVHAPLEKIKNLLTSGKQKEIVKIYAGIEKISFDYAVTEKIDKKDALIIKGDFGWNDIGAWDVLHNQLKSGADVKGNVMKGKVVHHDTDNCLLFGHGGRVLATLGMKDTIIVDTEDAILVCPKERAQDMKKLIEKMEAGGLNKYL